MVPASHISEEIFALKKACTSCHSLALSRIESLEGDGKGLAHRVASVLNETIRRLLEQLQNRSNNLNNLEEIEIVTSVLEIYRSCCQYDETLTEELAREGSHQHILQLMQYDTNAYSESDKDILIEVQDIAGEIASYGKFPIRVAPFLKEELVQRLPLIFSFEARNSGRETILIHQVTNRQSAQEDVGFVMWPSAVILSRYVMKHAGVVIGKRVLEIGAGCGLVGLAAARVQEIESSLVSNVILSDFNPMVLKNLQRNAMLNNVRHRIEIVGLDFYDQTGFSMKGWRDMNGDLKEQVDTILAADIICQRQDAITAANTIHDALRPGGSAFIVCANASHRFGVEHFETECRRVNLIVESTDVRKVEDGMLKFTDLEKTTGWCEDMNLTMFFVTKPAIES